MSFTVNFYKFSKKENSTKRPGDPTKTYTGQLKDSCGILNPTIAFNMGLTDSPYDLNYAYIPEFDRYYYVKEWTFENRFWVVSLQVDVLASWKVSIGASTCYILRSSQFFDGYVMDTTYPATNETTIIDQQQTTPWITDNIDNGTFVVGIAGQATTYYLFTKEALDLFFDYLFSDLYINDLIGDWSTIFPQAKLEANPIQFITSIMWMPFVTSGTAVSSIRVGYVDVPVASGATSRVDGSGLRSGLQTFTLQRHPQAIRGQYLNNAPWSSYTLFYPPWGTIQLDPNVMANSVEVNAIWNVDLRTGRGTLTITGADTHILSWVHSQIGVNYQVSQVLNSGFGIGNLIAPMVAGSIGALTGSVATVTGAIASTTSQLGDFAKSSLPSATTIGSAGGLDSLRGVPTLQYEFKHIVEEDQDHRGRPWCKNERIDTMSGYLLVSDADISIASTQVEQEAIRNYMEGGFFYE